MSRLPALSIGLVVFACIGLLHQDVEAKRPKSADRNAAAPRETRRNLPVLNTRTTQGRTRTLKPKAVKNEPDAVDVGGVRIINLDSMMAIAQLMPSPHISLSANQTSAGNASLFFGDGNLNAWTNSLSVNHGFGIYYPMQLVAGRDLELECQLGTDSGKEIKVSSISRVGPQHTYTTWDTLTFSGKTGVRTIKLLVDTHLDGLQPDAVYYLSVSSDDGLDMKGCTLDLKDP